ncbi:MAG: ABC transporter permease [Acidobacteria bacterium]|nr:ABC transporter permease [Acidobacteriota bacterium]
MNQIFNKYQRELSAALAFAALLLVVLIVAPSFYSFGNLRDLAVSNAAVLIIALGMTLVILLGEIDISVGSQFAVLSVVAGLLAKTGLPLPLVAVVVLLIGWMLGALNGALIAWVRIPSIVVTLALMVIWRDVLRWATDGAWVQGLPASFQWFGLGQSAGQAVIVIIALLLAFALHWLMRNVAAGRAVYATGSDAEAARLAGIRPPHVTFHVFALLGAFTALAALLNSLRFAEIPSNAGVGLELKAIAAVVVGGTAINGGRGTIIGTVIGVALLGTIGTALTYAGINPYWEKAIQGAIILAAVCSEFLFAQWQTRRSITA